MEGLPPAKPEKVSKGRDLDSRIEALLLVVFGKDWYTADDNEKHFAYWRYREYLLYKEAVSTGLRQIFKRYLRNPENDMIFQYFCKRIPIDVVFSVIDKTNDYCRANKKSFFSLKYIAGRVEAAWEATRGSDFYPRQVRAEGDETLWMYPTWLQFGSLNFDPWLGRKH